MPAMPAGHARCALACFSECLRGFMSAPVCVAGVELPLFLLPTAEPHCDPASLPLPDASLCGRRLKTAHFCVDFVGSRYRAGLMVGSERCGLSEGSQLD